MKVCKNCRHLSYLGRAGSHCMNGNSEMYKTYIPPKFILNMGCKGFKKIKQKNKDSND